MKRLFPRITALSAFLALLVIPVLAQTSTTGSIAGAVTDPTGAVVAGADVVIKNNGSSQENTVHTTDNGTFNVPSLATGVYTVTIKASGFKQLVVTEVKVDVAKASTVNAQLEIGAPNETVTIVGSGELIQTQSANVASTITGRQITDLPYASRNALDIVLFLPGTSTVGRPRQSSVNGLPKGALNITLDGVQVQDPLLKNSDGFFTYIQPKTDAIEEVTLSTATPGAESAGAGAVQIKFATRQGTSEFHGSAYIYHRNSFFNSNYWFNNRDLPEDPVDHKAPRARVLLTQPGVRFGGPILIPGLLKSRERAFFFVNYEEYRLPESTARQRTIFATPVLGGNFTYIPTGSSTPVVRNLFTLAAGTDCNPTVAGLQPCPSTIDPIVGNLLNEIQGSTNGVGGVTATSDPNLRQFSFINSGGQTRRFPTVNLSWNITRNHQLTNVWNYQQFTSVVDFLNGADPRFPGFPNFGSQGSNRFSNSTALVSKIGNSISNEARFSLVGGTTVFFPETSLAQFANQGGFSLGINAGGVTTATSATAPQRRNSPVQTFSDTLNWVKGNHTWSFGGNYTKTSLFSLLPPGGIVRGITFGIDQTSQGGDPANAFFNATNFPGASATQLTNARGIYATLIGRMTAVAGTAVADEALNYTLNGDGIERAGQNSWALFAQDQWRFRSNITLNFGLRYELQGPYFAKNNAYTIPLSFENVFGCSGAFNFFKPGNCTNPVTQMQRLEPGSNAYNTDTNNFAPNFGIAYSPDFKSGFLHRIFGDTGQSVIRAGFSIAYTQDGTNVGSTGLGTNPGQSFSVQVSTANGTLPIGSLFRTPGSVPTPTITAPTFPFTPGVNDQAVAFSPDLQIGYVQSWTFGIQREVARDTVFEVRYVGNRAKKLTRLWSLNEVNTIENGFANEFKLAQANLLANNASGVAARSGSFAFFGPNTGTSPLPIFLAYLNRSTAINSPAAYAGANWRATAITNNLVTVSPNVTGAAGVLSGNAGLRANAIGVGLPANFFVINPGLPAGAFLIDNSAASTYDALQVELRRRMSAGLLLQANYTFSHSMSDAFASSSFAQSNFTSIRNPRLNYGLSPYDIRHSFKGDFIYELPFGRGQRFGTDIGTKANWLLGGWGVNGTFRVQSGSPINFGNVQLVNMDRGDLQKMIEIRKNPTTVTWLPDDVITNTIRAFSISPTSPTGYAGTPPDTTKPFIAPAGYGNCQASFNGECGITNLVVYGPRFTRIDASLIKKVTFSENKNIEFRVEALNVINNQNFKVGSFAADTVSLAGTYSNPTFGQTTVAYQDTSTTTDPGGRVIQFVLRFNF